MIAIALGVTLMTVGLAIGCAAVHIHFDEQEYRLREKRLPKKAGYAIGTRNTTIRPPGLRNIRLVRTT